MSLDISNSGMKLEPGYAVGIICPNPDYLVNGLIERLSSSPLNVESSPAKTPLEWDKPMKFHALDDKIKGTPFAHLARVVLHSGIEMPDFVEILVGVQTSFRSTWHPELEVYAR
jgi:sulfite reductase alpha subunit-like flavoprotein